MGKTSIYFPHDYDARNDSRVLRLRMKHGAAGYGVYFMILERLRESDDWTEHETYDLIAFDLRVEEELVRSVVEDFGLFEISSEDGSFSSLSFTRRMGKVDDLSRKRAAAVSQRRDRQTETGKEVTKPLQNSTNVLQNSTNVLQKSDFVAENKNKNKNKNKIKITSTVVEVEETREKREPSAPTPSTEKDFIFDFKTARESWLSDTEWVAAVCRQSGIVPALVEPLLQNFGDYIRKRGKKHTDEGDARSHFCYWLEDARGQKIVKKLMAGIKNRVVSIPGQPSQSSHSKSTSDYQAEIAATRGGGDKFIRSMGYDPAKVKIWQAMSPEWRAANPPEYPPEKQVAL